MVESDFFVSSALNRFRNTERETTGINLKSKVFIPYPYQVKFDEVTFYSLPSSEVPSPCI